MKDWRKIVTYPEQIHKSILKETKYKTEFHFFRMGFDFFRISSLTYSSPLSILTIVDIEGRSSGKSCVQKRLIFENLGASNTLISPSIILFDRFCISPFSYKFYAHMWYLISKHIKNGNKTKKTRNIWIKKNILLTLHTFLSQVTCGILNNVLLTLRTVL